MRHAAIAVYLKRAHQPLRGRVEMFSGVTKLRASQRQSIAYGLIEVGEHVLSDLSPVSDGFCVTESADLIEHPAGIITAHLRVQRVVRATALSVLRPSATLDGCPPVQDTVIDTRSPSREAGHESGDPSSVSGDDRSVGTRSGHWRLEEA